MPSINESDNSEGHSEPRADNRPGLKTAKLAPNHPSQKETLKPCVQAKDAEAVKPPVLVHPAYRQRAVSGRAGDMLPLDHCIAAHGGTTSTYEELPHRLKISKQHQPLTLEGRIGELVWENGYQREELAYHKTNQKAGSKFYTRVKDIHARLGKALRERSETEWHAELAWINGHRPEELAYHHTSQKAGSRLYFQVMELHTKLKEVIKERSETERQAESRLLQYWGIDVEDVQSEGSFI